MKHEYITTPDDYKRFELEKKKATLMIELEGINREIAKLDANAFGDGEFDTGIDTSKLPPGNPPECPPGIPYYNG